MKFYNMTTLPKICHVLCNLIEVVLMKVYIIKIPTFVLNSAHAIVYHTLVVCTISTSFLHPLLCCKEDVGMDEAFYNPLQSPPLFLCL